MLTMHSIGGVVGQDSVGNFVVLHTNLLVTWISRVNILASTLLYFHLFENLISPSF